MTTAATSLLGLALPVTGELQGTWGTTVNDSITSLLDTAVAGTTTLSTDGDVTLTTTTLAANQARQAILLCSGARTALRTITAPAQSKIYTIINATTGGFSVKLVGVGPTTGLTIPNGASAVVAWNGSDFIEIGSSTVGNLTVNGNLTVTGTSTLTGAATLTANPTLSAGTANGVAYLNGSKVVTTGSALTFDGTNLGVLAGSVTSPAAKIHAVGSVRASTGAGTVYSQLASDGVYSTGTDLYLFAPTGYSNIFYANNSEGMRLTSTGLGIGATSPGVKLDVRGATGNGIRWLETSSGNTTRIQLGTAAGLGYIDADAGSGSIALGFRVGGANLMTLDSSGNLGLGVTPSAWSAMTALQVKQASLVGYVNQAKVMANVYYDGSNYKYIVSDFASEFRQDSGKHIWLTAPSGTAGNAITFTQAMTLDASGNLGVGVTSVTAPGASRQGIQVASAAGGAVLLGQNATATNNARVIGANSGAELLLAGGAGNPVTIYTDGSERARITSGGYSKFSNDGNYTNATSTYHEFYQTAASSAVCYFRATSGTYNGTVIEGTGDRTTTNTSYYLFDVYNGNFSGRFRVADSGNATNTNGSYGTISDAKMKTDIVDAGSQWADIKAIRFRKFKMKDDPEQVVQLGVVAQELEQTSPGLVEEHTDRDKEGNDLGTTTKSVKTSVLLMKAAVALQEAMTRIEQLEARVAQLESN